MASNDSGVDTSNDSNDGAVAHQSVECIRMVQVFENQLKEGFVLPQAISLDEQEHVSSAATSESIGRIRPRKKSCITRYDCISQSKERSIFENQSKEGFVLPQVISLDDQEHVSSAATSESIGPIRPRKKSCITRFDCIPQSKERKLRLAATTCNIELLTNLLDSGTDPNCSDEHKRSALHFAACRGYAEIVEKLLKSGADPNRTDSLGNTPLHLAVISGSPKNIHSCVDLLLKAGANVNMLDRSGKNPLQLLQSKTELLTSRHTNTLGMAEVIRDLRVLEFMLILNAHKPRQDEDMTALGDCLKNLRTTDDPIEVENVLARINQLSITK